MSISEAEVTILSSSQHQQDAQHHARVTKHVEPLRPVLPGIGHELPATCIGIAHEQLHPLDPLQPPEVQRAATICRSYCVEKGIAVRFNTVMLQEPAKAELLAYEAGTGPVPARRAQAVLILPGLDLAVEAVVELAPGPPGGAADRILLWRELSGLQPMNTPDDNTHAEQIIRSDPAFLTLMRDRYGVIQPDLIVVDTWACHSAPKALNHRRLMQGFIYLKLSPFDNEYAHPLDVVPIADLNLGRVVHIDMYDRAPAVPMECRNYHRDLQTQGWRTDLEPLNITQPQGPSFSVVGNLVQWQKWRLRVGFNAREGLVLHQVGYHDQGRLRPVLHRMSLVEMAVPYGDPGYPYIRKCAFDVGDYGFGFCANSLQLGCDCLGTIKYLDGVVNNAKGEPVVIKNAVCIHEEDHGLLWKHTDLRTGHVESRRSRRLVMQTVSTFQNYEYASSASLYQDGSIEYELRLTGILSTSVAHPGEERPAFGVRVAPSVNGSVHQHFFCMRIDPAIDDAQGGRDLVVSEVEAAALPLGPENPAGNAFVMCETDLTTVHQAQRVCNFNTARVWKIKNPAVINPISKEAVAYKLMPAPSPMLMAGPTSLVAQRAVFATKNLWVTPYADDQRYPAGEHVVQSSQCLGLAKWTQQDRVLAGADPVLWYSFGVTHAPRVEDFPVMPIEKTGFHLKPVGFFCGNPALDIPPQKNQASREVLQPLSLVGSAASSSASMACCKL